MRTENQRRSTNVEDRRGAGPARSAGMGGAGIALLLRLLFSRFGLRVVLPILALGIVAYLFVPAFHDWVDDTILYGAPPQTTELDPELEARYGDDAARILASTEDVWGSLAREQGASYPEPTLVLYTGAVVSGCGYATAAVGPFYCPADQNLYLDLGFFEDMQTQLGARGDFAQAYVIAHEIGHHVQNIRGLLSEAQAAQQAASSEAEANQTQVRVELMADCLAGVWAGEAERRSQIVIEPGDVQEAIDAAAAVGDDTLQRRSRGTVEPDSFTHGTSEQRMRWFERGFQSRDVGACEATQSTAYESL